MNTNEILSGLNEAITAYHRVPELEREVRTITEDRDFIKLQLDEAEAKISALQAKINNLELALSDTENALGNANATIRDLTSRNNELDRSLSDVMEANRNYALTLEERSLEIASLRLTKESLETKLSEAKGYGDRLADTLKAIGQKIIDTVAEPEVSADRPFPVSVPVELPIPANPAVDSGNSPVAVEPVDESAGADLVVAKDNLNEVAAGCNVYRYW